ncbi:unnamed protein product [Cladocopium goreaui]|uniref:LINE-1 reverse transcriptase homolog n=1 Tax=Cladocopium goreaui TaxID=2562237 RepID=A0A9P1FS25_9DINO|nr:unnamed protein product [Cladocopium goreaui]
MALATRSRQAWVSNTHTWQEFHEAFHQRFTEFTLLQTDREALIDEMHQHLMPTFHQFFRPKSSFNATEPQSQQQQLISAKWNHRAMMRQTGETSIAAIFHAWWHFGQYRKMKRQLQIHSKQIRKQKMRDLMDEVSHAATRNDSFAVYQAVLKYTPKQPRKRIRIRLPNGAPASPMEVLDMTSAYIKDLWLPATTIDVSLSRPPGVPFTKDALIWELAQTPVTKAVARTCLPGICWKTAAHAVANYIYPKLEEWWGSLPIFIPSQWKTAHLTFIHKPGKQPDRLGNLRPLALLEPVRKSILGLITTMFAAEVKPLLCSWPQLAFLPQRSTFDAIRRVILHCEQVRRLTKNQRRSVHQRAANHQCRPICGGIQVCLDAPKAFDMVPRQPLFDFLSSLDINQDLVAILAMWHSNTSYIVSQGTTTAAVGTGKGVRQGCRAAPVLWSSYTLDLFIRLSRKLGPEWVKKQLTMFADDLHSCDCFLNETELQLALKRIGVLLDVIEEMGLTLALDKHSHVHILQQYQLEHPLLLLLHAGTQLNTTIGQRLNHLQADDILWTADWTHLSALLQLLHSAYTEQYQVHLHTPATEALTNGGSDFLCSKQVTKMQVDERLPKLNAHNLTLLHSKPYGQSLLECITERTSYDQPGHHVLRCDVCGLQHLDLKSLHAHLHQEHRLDTQDWDPLRDMLLGTNPVCSHCMTLFADKSAVRHHITLGQCPSFNPLRQPATAPIPDEWQELLLQGDIQSLRQAPMKRLALTLTCQLCQLKFQRTGDLSLHLQTVHHQEWHDARNIVQLLIASCLCNPQTNASGLQHVCVPLRQLGMMALKTTVPVLLPWKFDEDQVHQFLIALVDHPLLPRLTACLMQRQFTQLWTDPLCLEFFRTTCLQCGMSMHPAELRDHIFSVHSSAAIMHDKILPQLMHAIQSEATADHKCDVSIINTSVLWYCSLFICFAKIMDAAPELSQEDSEMLDVFKHLSPLLKLQRFDRTDEGTESKKAKRDTARKEDTTEVMTLLTAMGHLLLRVDADQQAMKKQDSWICFMQTGSQALLPSLVLKATEWKSQQKELDQSKMEQYLPLRCFLAQHLADTMLNRLTKLAQCAETDQLKMLARQHGVLTQDNAFPFRKWNPHAQELRQTGQSPIPLKRMIKYAEQLVEILKDPSVTIRFHSMKPTSKDSSQDPIIPWMWQISMRADDLQVLLTTLQGSTMWSLLGMSMKSHAQTQSKPALALRDLMGKGSGKSKSKGKTKTKQGH